jgi:hypothetical protein
MDIIYHNGYISVKIYKVGKRNGSGWLKGMLEIIVKIKTGRGFHWMNGWKRM